MRKLYGDSLRKDAGFVKVMKNVASKNAKILESRAGKHAPEIKRVAREVIGTFDKVYEETADAVEEFLARCEYPDHSYIPVSPFILPRTVDSCAPAPLLVTFLFVADTVNRDLFQLRQGSRRLYRTRKSFCVNRGRNL